LPHLTTPWRTLYRFEEPRIARYEQYVASRFDDVWFISQRDRDLFIEGGQAAPFHVIPNSIDEDLFLLDQISPDASNLLFVGHLDVNHNIDAAKYMAEEVMPIILRDVPECQLQIVGAGSGKKLLGLQKLPGVRVVGYVPDLRIVFAKSAISVAPLRFSAGIQNKVIESMAAGLPVVTTGSVSAGLGTEPEQDLLVADNAKAFAWQVIRLLQDEHLRRRLGGAGRAFVKTHFSSRPAINRLDAISDQINW
jgi:glycosyltransferase involved in cell wall biosynthesis